MRILLVEDDDLISELVNHGLTEAGFEVDVAADGITGLNSAMQQPYDLLIMDIMLPGIDGLEVLRRLRSQGIDTPILILSGMGSVDDRVTGLDLGGDDYLIKPFAFAELLARVKSLLRRNRPPQETTRLEVSDLLLDLLTRRAFRAGDEIRLQPQEFSLLEFLMRNCGKVVSRAEILQHVWGYNFLPSTNLVEVHICRLREKIERPGKERLLKTIRGVGYQLGDDEGQD